MIGSTPISNGEFTSNSRHSERKINTPSAENPDSNSHDMDFFTLNSSTFAIDFDEESFEEHLNAATFFLKDNFSYSSETSRTLSADFLNSHPVFKLKM